MVRAWYMDEITTSPKSEHHRIPPKFVSLEELYKNSGVEYFQMDVENYMTDENLKILIKERKTIHALEIDHPTEVDLIKYYTEHFHTDDELRFVLEGCGYFDIRDKFEEWIRIEVVAGDLLVLPGGCYHRFTVDSKNQFKGIKFLQTAVYQAHNRPAEDMNCRKDYLKRLHNSAFNHVAN